MLYCDRITMRATRKRDEDSVYSVQVEAFGRKNEGELAVSLMRSRNHTISVLAESATRPVGHVLMSELSGSPHALALAPLGVIPASRELHVGTGLVRRAMDLARRAGYEAVFVLGDPAYYERFGFSAALAEPFEVPWRGPSFMAVELHDGALSGKAGAITYPEAFYSLG